MTPSGDLGPVCPQGMRSPAGAADVTLLFFAKARELVGAPQASVSVPAECSGAQLREFLLQTYPQLAVLQVRPAERE